MSDNETPKDVNYILTNTRCYHPFFGDARVLFDTENKKTALLFTLGEVDVSSSWWWFDEKYKFVIIENNDDLTNFVKLKEDDNEYILGSCGVDNDGYPIFANLQKVMFFGEYDNSIFVRFDGIVTDPIQYTGEYDAPFGAEAEQWFSGAEYLQAPDSRMPSPLINFAKTTIELQNYRDPTSVHDDKDKVYSLEIDTSMIAAWGKEEGGGDNEDFCGEYVGLGANANKRFRLGFGEWLYTTDAERLHESLFAQEDGTMLIDGLTYLTDEEKYVLYDSESEGGYWWTAKSNVKLGYDIILNYEQGNGAESKPSKTFVWQGYTWYAPKKIYDEDGSHIEVNAPLHSQKINAMDAPVWR